MIFIAMFRFLMISGFDPISTPLSISNKTVFMKVLTGGPLLIQLIIDVVPIDKINITVGLVI